MIRSADNLINSVQTGVAVAPAANPDPVSARVPAAAPPEPIDYGASDTETVPEIPAEPPYSEIEPAAAVQTIPPQVVEMDDTDEYGNAVKKKMYSEEEVQKMIRERLNRGGRSDAQNQQMREDARNFQPDPNSSESWEDQLEQFVDKVIEKRERTYHEKISQQQAEAQQLKYEANFNAGMRKYADFKEVVKDKPITDSMMLGTRGLSDPAGFIYAASKLQPKELERISRLADPYAQMMEIGKLDERMRKARATKSGAPSPITPIKGDAVERTKGRSNVDQRIREYAREKVR